MKHNSLLNQRKQKQTSHSATSPPLVTITTTPSRAATPAIPLPTSSHDTATLPDLGTQGQPSPKQDLHQKNSPTYSPPSSPTPPPLAAASPPQPSTPTPNPNTGTSCDRPWFFQSLHFWLGLIAGLSIGLLIVLLVVQGARTGALRKQFNQMQALLQQQQTALATLSTSSNYFPPHSTTTPQQPTMLRTPSQGFVESPPFYGSPGPFLS